MRLSTLVLAFGLSATVVNAAFADDVRVRVRGKIKSVDAQTLTLAEADAQDVAITLPANVAIATTKPFALADIKPGMMLGITTIKRADGANLAVSVHPIPPTVPAGQSAWDDAPGSVMNNGTASATVAATGGHDLTLDFKTGKVQVLVVPETRMAQAAPGTRADLKPGETVFVFALKGAAGKLTAQSVQVSKDGVKPVQ